jgi:hypothetical protein
MCVRERERETEREVFDGYSSVRMGNEPKWVGMVPVSTFPRKLLCVIYEDDDDDGKGKKRREKKGKTRYKRDKPVS